MARLPRFPARKRAFLHVRLAGLCATAITCIIIWRFAVRGIEDRRVYKFAAVMCLVTGIMGWPVWTVGLLPSVNGFSLGRERTIAMALERTQTTRQSESSKLNHWAWLRSYPGAMRPASGRYYIPEAVHADWSGRKPGAVPIAVAAGLLGAEVVTGFGPAK